MTHKDRIRRDLEEHPGSTYEDITRRTGIGSPHRRITGKESPQAWTHRVEERNGLYLHYADPLRAVECRADGTRDLGSSQPTEPPTQPAPLCPAPDRPEATEAEVDAALAKLGIERPRALA